MKLMIINGSSRFVVIALVVETANSGDTTTVNIIRRGEINEKKIIAVDLWQDNTTSRHHVIHDRSKVTPLQETEYPEIASFFFPII